MILSITNPSRALNQVLQTPIEVTVGDLLRVSKELSSLLSESMKFKVADQLEAPQDRQEQAYVNLTWTVSEPLINIPLSFSQYRNSNPVSAIVDTGLQLNIIFKEVCNELMFLPVNKKAHIRMHDANSGEGELIGLIEDI